MSKGKKSDAPEAAGAQVDGMADKPAEASQDAAVAQPDVVATPAPADAKSAGPAPSSTEPPDVTPPVAPTEPWPEATPEPRKPVEPGRARAETISMPVDTSVGPPPEVPKVGSIEDPTFMPAPRAVPDGSPDDPGTVPGRVPPGDSRSLRSGSEFALVYRAGTAVISRFGVVGKRGQWRVVEYPTTASASNAYAKECSRFVEDGFSDYRD